MNAKIPTLVEMNRSKSGNLAICLHPSGGGVSYYKYLAAKLEPYIRVIALEEPSIYDDYQYESIPELAEYHLDTILAIDDQGPYILFGYCSGGPIAYEIANQLSLMGKPVKRIVMFGSKLVSGYDPSVKEKYLFLKSYLGERFGLQLSSLGWPQFERMEVAEVADAIVGLLVSQKVEGIGKDPQWISKSIQALVFMEQAQKRYQAPKSRLNIDLHEWHYVDPNAESTIYPWCDWNTITSGNLNVVAAPPKVDNYLDILFDPYLDYTVDKVITNLAL